MTFLLDAMLTMSVTVVALSGLFVTYALLKVVNLAHGEMIAVGAYSATIAAGQGLGFAGSCLVGLVAASACGAVVERLVVRRFYGRNVALSLLGTWALSLAIIQLLRLCFGPAGRFMPTPVAGTVWLAGAEFPAYRLVVFAISVVMLGLLAVATRSRKGIEVRAAMEDASRAEAAGIDTGSLFQVTFVAGAALAGLAGALVAPLVATTPDMGAEFTTLGFLALLIGRSGRLVAGLGACAVLSLARSGLAAAFDANTAALLSYAGALVILLTQALLTDSNTSERQLLGWRD